MFSSRGEEKWKREKKQGLLSVGTVLFVWSEQLSTV